MCWIYYYYYNRSEHSYRCLAVYKNNNTQQKLTEEIFLDRSDPYLPALQIWAGDSLQAMYWMNHHLFTEFSIGQSDQCPNQICSMTTYWQHDNKLAGWQQTDSMTTEHLLQPCTLHDGLQHQTRTMETPVAKKLLVWRTFSSNKLHARNCMACPLVCPKKN